MARIASLPPLSELLRAGGPEALLAEIFGTVSYTLLETHDIFFRCGCSQEKVERALLSLGQAELDDICRKQEGAEVRCEFCRRAYHLDVAEIDTIKAEG